MLESEAEDKNPVVIRVSEPLGGHADIPSPRASFADWPRRRNQLYGWEGDWRTGRPVLTVYYLGGPDTTPEFTPGVALERYLASALAPRR